MPPTAVAYNHDAYPQAFEAAELQITNTYYALESFSTEKAGFSDPDSALKMLLSPVSQYTSSVSNKETEQRASFP